jgi:tetrapyrrole methylase family protein/MazG family protein
MSAVAAIHVVGLGPGAPEFVTSETIALLQEASTVILRTRHHPTVAALPFLATASSCDDLYAAQTSFEDVYAAIAGRVLSVAAAAVGSVVYAVPGHPLIAERSVVLLLHSARELGVPVRVHAAVSYIDVAATALRIDLGAVQLCDALDSRIDAQRPALISQIYDRDAATSLKLRLLDVYPGDHAVTVLSALGSAQEQVKPTTLAELDRAPFGHLDALYLPALAPIDDVRRFDGLAYIIQRLHAADGCPWDREQTHATLRPHLLEESYEALEAIDSGNPEALSEELGDVLLQVLMHAAVAERLDEFALADITEHIARKLIRRHPHVFGETTANTAEEVYQNWEALKQAEKPRSSILEGVPATLPALAASQAIQGRARRVGFDWPDIDGPLEKLAEEIGEFARAEGPADREDEFGDVLFVVANIAQRLGVDAEQALRGANQKFRRRFGTIERLAAERHLDLKDLDLAGLDSLWDEAKASEAAAAG